MSKKKNRTLKLKDALPEKKVGTFHDEMLGTSGTEINAGYIDEDYLQELNSSQKADVYDKMGRSDDQITMLLTARKNPIKRANWHIEAATSADPAVNEQYKKMADHIEYELFERMDTDFEDFLEEILTFIDFGYSLFEKKHEVIKNDPRYGTYVGFEKFGWRSQRTIERFNVTKENGLETVTQQAQGDLHVYVDLPAQYLVIFSLNKRGDNYEGISSLRPIYGNYKRKNKFRKLIAIGIERYAVGTPIGTVPAGKENTSDSRKFEKVLSSFTSHQKAYIKKPQGWDIDFTKDAFDAEKVEKVIESENLGMAKSFVAIHLQLGTGGNGGAFALGTDFSSRFLSIIEGDASIARRGIQKKIIKEFIDFNYGKQADYPQLKVTGINDKLGKEFAEIVKSLAEQKFITPTTETEKFLRKNYKMNKLTEEQEKTLPDVREKEAPALFVEDIKSIKFAESKQKIVANIRKQLKVGGQTVQDIIDTELQAVADKNIKRIKGTLNTTPQSQWLRVARTEEFTGYKQLNDALKEALTEAAWLAIDTAKKEVPGNPSTKFTEVDKLLAALPYKTKETIKTQIALIVASQGADLEKNVLFTLSSSVKITSDVNIIVKDMANAASDYLAGPSVTAAGNNSMAIVYNEARSDYFEQDEILEEIAALEFVNPDPKSPVCIDLAGTIYAKDDPEAKRWEPPLHHNCKSIILPIFELAKNQKISKTGLQPSNPELGKYATLKTGGFRS
jgi:phage gp29-like protein